jgi:hypothetical protein
LVLGDDVGGDGDMIDFVFCDDIELVGEFSDYLGSGFDGYCYLTAHAHGDLDSERNTGPISLRAALTKMLLGRLMVMRCEMTSSFLMSIFNS